MDAKQEKGRRINTVLLLVITFLVFVQFIVSLTTLPVFVRHIGGTEFHSGMQTTLFFLAAVCFRFYFGPLSDQIGRKTPMLIGSFVFATANLLFLAADQVWLLGLVRIYQAIGMASFFSGASSLIADLAPPEKTGLYIGLFRLTNSMALLVGPAMALAIIIARGFDTWFLTSFLMGMLAFILMFLLKPAPLSGTRGTKSRDRVVAVLRNRRLWPIYGLFALGAIGNGALFTFVLVYIGQVTQVANPGIYFTYFALGGVGANLSAGYLSDRFGRLVIVWPAILFLGLGITSLYFLPGRSVVLLLSSIMAGIGYSGAISALMAWLVDVVDGKNRATALGFQESILDISVALGSLALGFAGAWIGLGSAYGLTGMVTLLVALASLAVSGLTIYFRNNKVIKENG